MRPVGEDVKADQIVLRAAQLFQRAAHAFLRGIVADAERGADGAEIAAFIEAQQDRASVGVGVIVIPFGRERCCPWSSGRCGCHGLLALAICLDPSLAVRVAAHGQVGGQDCCGERRRVLLLL